MKLKIWGVLFLCALSACVSKKKYKEQVQSYPSVLRAISVARVLQNDFDSSPTGMISSGRSEYIPLVLHTNETNPSLNQRTRLVIIPPLDQFFKLLETKN